MPPTPEQIISVAAALVALALLVFAVDWRYFRDWVMIFLFKCTLDFLCSSPVTSIGLVEYPFRQLPHYYDTSLLFEIWVFPVLCILFNQMTMKRGLGPIIAYAVLFSAGITVIEYPLELYTRLIDYHGWSWYYSFATLTVTFLISRGAIAFYRWGCRRFPYPDRS